MKNNFYTFLISFLLSLTSLNLSAISFNGGNGTARQPFSIVSAEQLDAVRNYLGVASKDVHFRLDADIDFGNYNNSFWMPIGGNGSEDSFQGKFNGNGKKIFNLRIGRQGNFHQYTGLFGRISDGAEIRNLTLESGEIIANTNTTESVYVGAIVGYISSDNGICIIDSCTNKISVTGGNSTHFGSSYTGGICGFALVSSGAGTIKITNCLNTGNITGKKGTGSYTGGICGQALAASSTFIEKGLIEIVSCMNIGTVAGGIAFSSVSATGGICGYSSGFGSGYPNVKAMGNVSINYCINSGIIAGGEKSGLSESYTGGICGYQIANGNIYGNSNTGMAYCINNGIVLGTNEDENTYTGGLSGFIGVFSNLSGNSLHIVSNNYSHAFVPFESEGNVGAIAGKVTKNDAQSSTATFNTNYWFAEDDFAAAIDSQADNIKISVSDIAFLEADEFKSRSSFVGWAFGENWEMPWKIREGFSLPYLFAQSAPIQIVSENEDELVCSVMPGIVIDSIVIYRKTGIEYKELKTVKVLNSNSEGLFTIDIHGTSNEDFLRLISFEQNKMPSNPEYFIVTKATASSSENIQKEAISIYPNPVQKSEQVYIIVEADEQVNRLEMFTLTGIKIGTYVLTGTNNQITAPSATGTYLLNLITEAGKIKYAKVIVQ